MQSKPTEPYFPAVIDDDEAEPIPLEVDPYGELDTEPIMAPDSIPTNRPTLTELSQLLEASQSRPRFEYDWDVRSWILAEPFTASQVDTWGNTYIVPCRRGILVNISLIIEPRAIRSECVRCAINEDRTIASIIMKDSRFPVLLGRLNDAAAAEVANVFYVGDMS